MEIMIDNLLSRIVLLFSCNPIGQHICIGGPSYSSRPVSFWQVEIKVYHHFHTTTEEYPVNE